MIPPRDSERFFSGVRAIGYDTLEFLVSERGAGEKTQVIISRGPVQRMYNPREWIEHALGELRAGIYGRRQRS